ncbi:NAD-dependent epimerase/dehydratase family protein [Alphaproteobacteria bacterium]|nr:NAD-dependent epimerase/dehydratase family protein [Alphaproteobacteria bacterium]
MKIAVTGSTGYLGSNLLKELYKIKNYKVVELSRKKNLKHQPMEHIFFDLNEDIITLPEDIDWLIHCAADLSDNPISSSQEVNFSKNLLQLCKANNIKFIFISSCMSDKKSKLRYGRVKYLIEKEVIKMNGLIIRPGWIFGGHERGRYQYITLIKKLKILPIFFPSIFIQPTYVNDIFRVIFKLFTLKKFNKHIYSVGHIDKVSFHVFIKNTIKYKTNEKKYFIIVPNFIFSSLLYLLSLLFNFFRSKYYSFKYFRKSPYMNTFETEKELDIKFLSIEEAYKFEEKSVSK